MRFYRTDDGRWFATQAEATAHARRLNTRWGPVDVPTEKPALLAWLAAQAAPGPETLLGPQGDIAQAIGAEPTPSNTAFVPDVPTPESYAARSVALDEAFAALPLARKLDLAAQALEEARQLPPLPAPAQ